MNFVYFVVKNISLKFKVGLDISCQLFHMILQNYDITKYTAIHSQQPIYAPCTQSGD